MELCFSPTKSVIDMLAGVALLTVVRYIISHPFPPVRSSDLNKIHKYCYYGQQYHKCYLAQSLVSTKVTPIYPIMACTHQSYLLSPIHNNSAKRLINPRVLKNTVLFHHGGCLLSQCSFFVGCKTRRVGLATKKVNQVLVSHLVESRHA